MLHWIGEKVTLQSKKYRVDYTRNGPSSLLSQLRFENHCRYFPQVNTNIGLISGIFNL